MTAAPGLEHHAAATGCPTPTATSAPNCLYTFEPDAGGTLVRLTDEIEMTGIAGVFEPLMARLVRVQYQTNLGRLKEILEARPASEA